MDEGRPAGGHRSVLRAQVVRHNVAVACERLHQAQAVESAVAEHQGPGNRLLEPKLRVPQRVFGESRTGREEFGADSPPPEWLALHVNLQWLGSDPGVTKNLNNRVAGTSFLAASPICGLLAVSPDSAARGAGQHDGCDAPKHAGRSLEPIRHLGVVGRQQASRPDLTGLRIVWSEPGERPLQVIHADGALRGNLDYDASNRRVGVLSPD